MAGAKIREGHESDDRDCHLLGAGEHVMISPFGPESISVGQFVGYLMRPSAAPVLGEVLNCSESIEGGPYCPNGQRIRPQS